MGEENVTVLDVDGTALLHPDPAGVFLAGGVVRNVAFDVDDRALDRGAVGAEPEARDVVVVRIGVDDPDDTPLPIALLASRRAGVDPVVRPARDVTAPDREGAGVSGRHEDSGVVAVDRAVADVDVLERSGTPLRYLEPER